MNCTSLINLDLSATGITRRTLEVISNQTSPGAPATCTGLRTLKLNHCNNIGDHGLVNMVYRCPGLVLLNSDIVWLYYSMHTNANANNYCYYEQLTVNESIKSNHHNESIISNHAYLRDYKLIKRYIINNLI